MVKKSNLTLNGNTRFKCYASVTVVAFGDSCHFMKPNILVIEDNSDVAGATMLLLQRRGCRIVTADNPACEVQQARTNVMLNVMNLNKFFMAG